MPYDVFLSYNRRHQPDVEKLAGRLREAGIRPWLDQTQILPGDRWQKAMGAALKECPVCAVIIGPGPLGDWQIQEAELAIQVSVELKGMRVIPVLLPGAERGKMSDLPDFLLNSSFVEFADTLDDERAFHLLIRGIKGDRSEAPLPETDDNAPCPYRGLSVFGVEHAPLFFGREVLTDWLVSYLRPGKSRFLAIVGPSGSGKSSLALAGLTASLARGEIKGSERWPRTILRPGSDPVEALALEIRQRDRDLDKQMKRLRADPRALHRAVADTMKDHPGADRYFLLVDQFEEIFTLCTDEELRLAFINNLLEAATVPNGPTIVAITVRADFYGYCATHARLAAAVADHQMLVGPMSEQELRQAIERPAQKARREFAPGLIDLILADVREQAGQLPLLEFALSELWNRAGNRRLLTLAAYREIGGITGALQGSADKLVNELPVAQQETCRHILLRLTHVGPKRAADTKQRIPLEELVAQAPDRESARAVIATLSGEKARLLTVDAVKETVNGAETKTVYVEVAHEALIRDWPKLRDWVDANRIFLLWQQRLEAAMQAWEKAGREEESLLHGASLVEANEFLKNESQRISEAQAKFIRSSSEAHERRERRLIDLNLQAEEQARLSRSRELAAAAVQELESDPERSILLALKAAEEYTGEAHNALQRALEQSRVVARSERHTGPVNAVAYSPVAELVASGGEDGFVRLWDVEAGHDRFTFGGEAAVTGVAFRPDGKHLAASSKDGLVRVWNADKGGLELVIRNAKSPLTCVAYNEDGEQIAAGAADGTVRVWSSSGTLISEQRAHDELVRSVRFVRWGGDSAAAICSGGEDSKAVVRTYEGSAPQVLATFASEDIVSGVAYDSESRLLATSSYDRTVTLRDLDPVRSKPNHIYTGLIAWVTAVSLSKGGARLAAGSFDGPLRVWDTDTGKEMFPLFGHPKAVKSCAFSASGNRLATASLDGTVRIWRTDPARESFTRETHPAGIIFLSSAARRPLIATCGDRGGAKVWDPLTGELVRAAFRDSDVWAVALNADGSQAACACGDNRIRVWDVRADVLLRELPGHEHWIVALAFSPDGRHLASCGADKTARIWNLETGEQEHLLAGHTNWVNGIAYSPDGRLLATSSNDRSIKLWNPDTGGLRHELAGAHEDWIQSVAFHPSEPWLASASHDRTVKIWNFETHEMLRALKGHGNWVRCVAFSPDGSKLVTGDADRIAKVWDSASGDFLFDLTGHAEQIWGVGFTADGSRIATASFDNTARIWDARTGAELLTLSEAGFERWQEYSPDGTARLQSVHIDDLMALARKRLTRPFSAAEHQRYRIEREEPQNLEMTATG